MEESWRFRPIQGNICPTCSISHIPFCSQPLSYDRNVFGGDGLHRFPNDPSLRRPYFDPFLDNRATPRHLSQFDNRANSVRPIPGNPIDSYGISQSLNRNPNLERDMFSQFPSLQGADPATFNGIRRDGFQLPPVIDYGDNGFVRGEFLESDRTHKRMRVYEMGASSLTQMPPPVGGYNSNPKRISLENERRLNLIRDHGGPSNFVQSHGGMGLGSIRGGFTEQEDRLNEYFHENSLGERANFDESRRTDWQPMLQRNTRINNLHEPRFGSVDRMGPMLHPDPVIDTQYHFFRDNVHDDKKELLRGEHASVFVQQQMQSNMNGFRSVADDAISRNTEGSGKDALFNLQNEQWQHSHYGQVDNPSLQSHGPSNVPAGSSFYVSPARQSQESSNLLREEEYQHVNWRDYSFSTSRKGDMNQQPHIPDHVPYPISQDSREKYNALDFQQLQPKDFNPAKELQYSHIAISQVSSGSNIPYHENKHNLHFHGQQSDVRRSYEVEPPPLKDIPASIGHNNLLVLEQCGVSNVNKQGDYLTMPTGNILASTRLGQVPAPPLPPLPPPSLPVDTPGLPPSHLHATSSLPKTSFSVYPIPTSTSASMPLLHTSALEGQPKHPSPDKPKIIDASRLFWQPHRATRPDHLVIILRGLPGSGKSYLAKMLRDLEVENGGSAPRIHSMDDYFMTEVEKVEESEGSKFSGYVKGKKRTMKRVMEYCYEPEMEEAYRSSMLKAFKKTLEEGNFTFIIVDDRNLRVADFAQFWASAKRSGYEVYLLEATYKDPVGCAARDVHGFTSDDIQKMAELWEEAPSLYLRLDIQSLFHGDDLKEHGIQEVDMDMEDATFDEGPSGSHNSETLRTMEPAEADCVPDGSFKDGERSDTEGDDPTGVKELRMSKWSHDVDEEDVERPNGTKGNSNALSGLIQAYTKGDKSVHWGDQVGKTGFSIGAAKKADILSLVIGPGAGYNLKSNPLSEEENVVATKISWESKKRSVFQEQLRAERESFRAVFDRRRQRIGGFEMEDE